MLKPIFTNNSFYHLFNRGIEKRKIFLDEADYRRFLESMIEFNKPENTKISFSRKINQNQVKPVKSQKPLVLICAYCLIYDHFHLLVKQLVEGGISKYLQKLATGYTMYFNQKYKREGRLFQSSFKAVRVETDEQLLHLSRYIHLNPIKNFLDQNNKPQNFLLRKKLKSYPWSSYEEFVDINHKNDICKGLNEILDLLKTGSLKEQKLAYQKFVESYILDEEIKVNNLILED